VPFTDPAADQARASNGAVGAGGVLAMKLTDAGGTLALQPGWLSHDMAAPATPITVNGVVFALSTGRPGAAPNAGTVAQGRGTPAILRAYEGASGRALWMSGASMTSFASARSFWSAMGQVYVGADNGAVYAFGFLDERR
jgi:hypothetical protein